MKILIKVPATTSNLGPGFDCFGMAVSLHLEVEAEPARALSVTAEGGEVPLDKSNLVLATFLNALGPGVPEPQLHLHIKNRIPLARGLGSSASARVAGLALAEAWKKQSAAVDLPRIAQEASRLEGHPDNATPAVFGGFCVSSPSGHERLVMDKRPYWVVIPTLEIHTEAAREALPKSVSLTDAVHNLQYAALGVARLARLGHLGALVPFPDRLHQRHRLALDPRLSRAYVALSALPPVESLFLSGSGPTVFVLARDRQLAPEPLLAALRHEGLDGEVREVLADNEGLQVTFAE
jgi:homoserine kinase